MSVLQAKSEQTSAIQVMPEGYDVLLKALRDGTLTVASWIAALSLEGRIFTANVGTDTQAASFGDGTLDTAEYDLHVAVPSTVAIIPLQLVVHFDTWGTAQICEVVMQSGSGSTCGAGTAITVQSSNKNAGIASLCTVTSVATATSGVALTTNVKEIYHDGAPMAITIATVAQVRDPNRYEWNALKSGILDVVGPSQQLVVYASSQAGTGFITLKYIELLIARVV